MSKRLTPKEQPKSKILTFKRSNQSFRTLMCFESDILFKIFYATRQNAMFISIYAVVVMLICTMLIEEKTSGAHMFELVRSPGELDQPTRSSTSRSSTTSNVPQGMQAGACSTSIHIRYVHNLLAYYNTCMSVCWHKRSKSKG